MADEDRIIIETAVSPAGIVRDGKKVEQAANALGDRAGKAIGDGIATGTDKATKATQTLTRAQLAAELAAADHAGKVRILKQALDQQAEGSTRYYQIQKQLIVAEQQLARVQQKSAADNIRAQKRQLVEEQKLLTQQEKAARQAARTPAPFDRARTFAGFTGGGLVQAAGALGAVTSITEFIGTTKQFADAGRQINASIDGNRVALGALLQDVERGDRIFEESSEFARRYGFTQQETAEAVRSASSIFRESAASTEKILEVQARLAAFSPEQGLTGASFAIRELASGDTQSLVERFEISRRTVNAWKAEVMAGADVVEVLDRGLNELGITNDTLTARTEGLAGAERLRTQAIEDLQRRLGELVASSGWVQYQTALTRQVTGVLGGQGALTPDKMVAEAFSYQQYLTNANAFISSNILSSDPVKAVDALRLAFSKLTEEQYNTIKASQDYGDAQSQVAKTVPVYTAAGRAAQQNTTAIETNAGAAKILESIIETTNDQIARETIELKKATAALAPYEQAVQDAADANEDARQGLADAEAEREKWRNAQIEGEKALSDELFAIEQERAQAELDLLNFRTGGGLDAALEPYRGALAAAERDTQGFVDAQEDAEDAVADATAEYEYQVDALDAFDQAVDSAKNNLDDQNDALQDAKDYLEEQNDALKESEDRYEAVTDAIKAQQGAIDDWKSGPLIGDRADRERLQAYDDQINSIEQRISRRKLAGADDDDDQLEALENQLDRVQEERRLAQLEIEAGNDRRRRELEDLANSREQENTYGDAVEGIKSGLNETERLEKMYGAHQDAIDAQKEVVAEAQAAVEAQEQAVENAQAVLDAATEAQRLQTVQIENAKSALDKQKAALDLANEALSTQRQRVDELAGAIKTAEQEALAPFEARLQTLDDQASRVDLEGRLKFAPLKKLIDEAGQSIEEFPFDVLLAGVNESERRVAEWRNRVAETTTNLDAAKDALERQKQPIEDQQKRIDALNLSLDTMKADLDSINTAQATMVTSTPAVTSSLGATNPLYATFATNAEKIAAQLTEVNNQVERAQTLKPPAWWSSPIQGQGGPKVNPAALRGSGNYDANAIDQILAGTGLAGKGSVIAAFAEQYNVPAELALAMFRKEASFLNEGSSVANNNPGNIVYTGGAYGEDRIGDDGRFGHYATVTQGIEAYFQLLDREYREFIDSGNIEGLINKYAPPFENDSGLYIRQVQEWMLSYLEQIATDATRDAAATYTRGSEVGVASDPVLSDQAVDVVVPNGRQSDGYSSGRDTASYKGQHLGLDIAGKPGMDVKAVRGGRVVFAAPNEHGGVAVIIENDAGEQWYYGHLRGDVDVLAGQDVSAGQVIGQIGNLNHVHLQLRRNGALADPSAYLEQLAFEGSGPGNGPYTAQNTRSQREKDAFPDAATLSAERTRQREQQRISDERAEQYARQRERERARRDGTATYTTQPVGAPSLWTPTFGTDDPIAPVIGGLEDLLTLGQRLRDEFTTGDPVIPSLLGDDAVDQIGRAKDGVQNIEKDLSTLLGVGERGVSGDESLFGGGGGYGATDPVAPSIIGDTGIGEDFQYGIEEPIAESIITAREGTDEIKYLLSRSNFEPVLAEANQNWLDWSQMAVIQNWRDAIDYVRPTESALRDLARSAELSAERVKEAAGEAAGAAGGGGNGGGAPPAAGNVYVTLNTENPNRLWRAAKSRGKV